MAGMEFLRLQSFKIGYCAIKLMFRWILQMESTNNVNNAAVATNLFCIFYDVADPGMGTAGYDNEPCIKFVHKG